MNKKGDYTKTLMYAVLAVIFFVIVLFVFIKPIGNSGKDINKLADLGDFDMDYSKNYEDDCDCGTFDYGFKACVAFETSTEKENLCNCANNIVKEYAKRNDKAEMEWFYVVDGKCKYIEQGCVYLGTENPDFFGKLDRKDYVSICPQING
ncbi:MAG: hypothetical protein ACP5N3_01265 [Candidatus Nanoarchaeia archaeon]